MLGITYFRKKFTFLGFSSKKILFRSVLPLIALFVNVGHYIFVSNFGSTPPWGTTFEIFNLISNVQVFYLFIFLGNLIIVRIFLVQVNNHLIDYNNTKQKQWFFLGLLFYLIGIFSLFHFSILEPFVLLYLLVLLFIYKNISSIIQPEYSNFSFFDRLTPWHPSTKAMLNNYVSSGNIDIGLLFLILFGLLLFLIFILDPTALVRDETLSRIRLKRIKLDFQNQKHARIVFLGETVYLLSVFMFLTLNTRFLIGVLLLIFFPMVRWRKKLKEIRWTYLIPFKIDNAFVFYQLLAIILAFIFLLVKHALIIHHILFFILILVSVVSWRFKRVLFKNNEIIEEKQLSVNITYHSLYHAFFWGLIILYIGSWIINDSLEEILIKTIGIFLLGKYGYKFMNNLNSRMINYILIRLINLTITFFAISVLIFSLIALFTKFLLNNALEIWLNWIFHFLLGDLGTYVTLGRLSITKKVLELIHPTFEISFIPLLVSIYISITLAKYAVSHFGEWRDNLVLTFVVIGMAIPSFILIVFLILIFSGQLKIFPSFGQQVYADLYSVNLLYIKLFVNDIHFFFFNTEIIIKLDAFISFKKIDWLFHFILPLTALSIFSSVYITKLLRISLYNVMNEDYITSAKAFGFSEKTILNKHAFLNSLIPILTFIGLMVGTLLTTMPIIEYITVWQGIGYFGLDALLKLNAEFTSLSSYSIVLSVSMIIALMILFSNLIIDLTYAMIDPRVTY